MYAKIYGTGIVTNILAANDGRTIIEVKSSKVNVASEPANNKESYALIDLVMREGYETYSGKVAVGDCIFYAGRMVVSEEGGPVFSESDGLPVFYIEPWILRDLGVFSQVYGHDEFSAIIVGNLGRDPESRFLDNGTEVTNFSLATSRKLNVKGADVQETIWWRVSTWKKNAENAGEMLKKGSRVLVEGTIAFDSETHRPRTFTDKNGALRSGFEISATNFKILSSKHGNAPRTVGEIPVDEEEEETSEVSSQTAQPAQAAPTVTIPF